MTDSGEGATIRRLWIAQQLRKMREDKQLTAQEVARRLDWSHSKVVRMEQTKIGVQPTDIGVLCDLYGASPEHKTVMLQMAREAKRKTWHQREYADVVVDWFSQYIGLEGSATRFRAFESVVIPAFFQTESYARAVTIATLMEDEPAEIERKVALRMKRQRILFQDPVPDIYSIVDENALRRLIGGSTVMREQLSHLIEATERPNVTFRVVPFEAGAHAGMTGHFVIMDFSQPFPSVVYTDSLLSARYLKEKEDVDQYERVFRHLQAEALNPKQSLELVKQVRNSLR